MTGFASLSNLYQDSEGGLFNFCPHKIYCDRPNPSDRPVISKALYDEIGISSPQVIGFFFCFLNAKLTFF